MKTASPRMIENEPIRGFSSRGTRATALRRTVMARHAEHPVLIDIVLGLVAGLAAPQMTNMALRPLKWVTPDSVERQEKKVRPGASSSLVAARKAAKVLNVSLSEREEAVVGTAIHFAVGIGSGPVYALLRRYAGLRPVVVALASGVAMSLVLDEGVVPAAGLSAPNHHYHP